MHRHPLPPLNLLPAFEAAGRCGSFKAAAKELHLTPSAVSQQIKALEDALGVPLFERSSRAVTLTEAGRTYLEDVKQLLLDLEAATRRLRRHERPEVLRVSTTTFVASEFLIPRLAAFRESFPEVELRIESSTHLVDLTTGEFDAALRVTAHPAPGTRTLRIGSLTAAPVCAPMLAHGVESVDDILQHRLIELRSFADRGWKATFGASEEQILTFDTYLETMRAAEQGLGFAFAIFPLTTDWVRRGRLAAPVALREEFGPGLQWVCRASERRPLADAVGTWLAEQAAGLPALDG